MKLGKRRFIVQFNDGSHINIPAERMIRDGDYLIALSGDEMVAFVDPDWKARKEGSK